MDVNTEGIKYIPNAFYDMMVFIVPTMQICAFGYIGISSINISKFEDISGTSLVILILALILVSYEYGRMAEALSAYVVQGPLKFIGKHTRFFRNQDFMRDREEIYDVLGLDRCYDGRKGDKWAIYLFAFYKKPVIGSDLLKRYAWEKLARNSAFTYAILFFISLVRGIYLCVSGQGILWLPFDFGNGAFTITCAVLVYLTYLEYYRRNIWNYDLLTKAIPIILA